MKVTTDSCLFGAWVARWLSLHMRAGNALDIGAGTGLLSLMIAQKTDLHINAIEIDSHAAEQARENIQASAFAEQIHLIKGDILQDSLPDAPYAVIFSNPPFYENDMVSPDAQKNKAHHHTGLRLPDLIKKAESLQVDGGLLFLLLPARRLSEIKSLLQLHHMQLESILHVHQTPSHAAFRILIRAIKTKTHNILCEEKTLIIKNAESSYTNEFVQLLKDYYLYL